MTPPWRLQRVTASSQPFSYQPSETRHILTIAFSTSVSWNSPLHKTEVQGVREKTVKRLIASPYSPVFRMSAFPSTSQR